MLVLALASFSSISVSFPPLPLPQALQRLSSVTGQRLACAPALRDEVLLASLNNADRERVEAEIASTFDARWQMVEGGLLLTPDPAARRQRRQRAAAEVTSDLKQALSSLAARAKAGKADFQANEAKYIAALKSMMEESDLPDTGTKREALKEEILPGWRATASLAEAFGAHDFQSMAIGERIVFSEDPTPMQRAFGGAMASIVDEFRREIGRYQPNAIQKVRLVVNRFRASSFSLLLEAVDAGGSIVDGGGVMLGHGVTFARVHDPLGGEDAPSKDPTDDQPLVITPAVRAYIDLFAPTQSAIRDANFDRWRQTLADPVAHEPLSWYPGAAFVAVAKAKGQNLLGTLDDACMTDFLDESLTPSTLFRRYDEDVTRRDGWILLHGHDASPRFSRRAAGALYDRAVRQGGLGVDAAADWIAAYPTASYRLNWFSSHLRALAPGSTATLSGQGIRFWSLLDASARQALRKGSPLSFANLPPAARDAVARQVFWLDAISDEVPTEDHRNARREITELLPQGIRNGTLSMTISEKPVTIAWDHALGEPVFGNPLTAEGFGIVTAHADRLVDDRFRMGVQRTYTLTFGLGRPDLAFALTMIETNVDLTTPPLVSLPEAFRKEADEVRRKAAETGG